MAMAARISLVQTLPFQLHPVLRTATVRTLLHSEHISNQIVSHSAGGRKLFSFPLSKEIKETARTLLLNYKQLPYQFPFSSLVKYPQNTHKSPQCVLGQGN